MPRLSAAAGNPGGNYPDPGSLRPAHFALCLPLIAALSEAGCHSDGSGLGEGGRREEKRINGALQVCRRAGHSHNTPSFRRCCLDSMGPGMQLEPPPATHSRLWRCGAIPALLPSSQRKKERNSFICTLSCSSGGSHHNSERLPCAGTAGQRDKRSFMTMESFYTLLSSLVEDLKFWGWIFSDRKYKRQCLSSHCRCVW